MARIRTVKPSFYKDEDLAEIAPLGRILFQGLWGLADREGRLEDRPKFIKAEILPYDDADVEDLIRELHDRGFVVRYEVFGRRYIQVVNLVKHQTLHTKEADSEIPECPTEALEAARDRKNHFAFNLSPENPGNPGKSPAKLSSHARDWEGKGKEQEGKGRELSPRMCAREEGPDLDEGFDEFWATYPKHDKRKACLTVWRRKKLREKQAEIMAALAWQIGSPKWTRDGGQYASSPLAYLNGDLWTDERSAYGPWDIPPRASPHRGPTPEEIMALAFEGDDDTTRGGDAGDETHRAVSEPWP